MYEILLNSTEQLYPDMDYVYFFVYTHKSFPEWIWYVYFVSTLAVC